MIKYLIQRCQVVYLGGQRDTVNLIPPVTTFDLEGFRKTVRAKHPTSVGVNLTYQEFEEEE